MESLTLKPKGAKQSLHFETELAGCSALIADGDNTSRSVLARQLREFGFAEIVQQSRIEPARELIETRRFDVILCAQYFGGDSPTGQELLDDLRRDALLPFATVFIMVTGEASYAKVEQAAELSLDGYLLKPHSAANLVQRLLAARRRKQELASIFAAIEQHELPLAITLCQQRYESRGVYWLHSARLGAELMLRTAQFEQAGALYQSVVTATGEPWARAGVARAMLAAGKFVQATQSLLALTQDLPNFADAFDVLGRAQLKLGQLEQAMSSYRQASALTPSSIARLQRLGMLAYYLGDATEAEQLLNQATHMGRDSRSFDYQTLVLLALLRSAQGNWHGVQRCRILVQAMLQKSPDIVRLHRVGLLVEGVSLLQQPTSSEVAALTRELGSAAVTPDFDFDLACNLLNLLSLLASANARLMDADRLVNKIGHRFCTSEASCTLLTAAAKAHKPYALIIRQSNEHLLELSEQAMKLHLQGDYRAAIDSFLALAEEHLNARMFETANQLFHRYMRDLTDGARYLNALQSLRERVGVARSRPGFGDSQGRLPAGMVLRISAPLPDAMNNW
jgi:CheY-like chemotaxis protein